MKILLLITLSLIIKFPLASLDFSNFNDEQICMFAKDPPLPVQVIFEIETRKITCNEGNLISQSDIVTNKASTQVLHFKRWNKMLRGKAPVYSTRSGTNLKIDTIGDKKSITIDKAF
tara:strand:- start:177 stop:527 length:351 start_codon:yes stop_codon:yes gene_type:complete